MAPYGVDLNRFTRTVGVAEREAALRRQYGGQIILATGRLVYYKGMQYLVEAMRDVPRAHLVIVGRGPLLAKLEQTAAAGRGNVSFVPHLPEEDLVAINYAQENVGLPSVEPSEAFGIVQLEAMACGKPVIPTDLSTGVTYVNQDGVTGLVVPRRDPHALAAAINRLLDDPVYARGLGEAARRRVQSEFALETMVNRVARLYEDLLRAPRWARMTGLPMRRPDPRLAQTAGRVLALLASVALTLVGIPRAIRPGPFQRGKELQRVQADHPAGAVTANGGSNCPIMTTCAIKWRGALRRGNPRKAAALTPEPLAARPSEDPAAAALLVGSLVAAGQPDKALR